VPVSSRRTAGGILPHITERVNELDSIASTLLINATCMIAIQLLYGKHLHIDLWIATVRCVDVRLMQIDAEKNET